MRGYLQTKEDIKKAITSKDCLTFCGLPLNGKTRLVKDCIQELELQDSACFINLESFKEYDSNENLLKNLREELSANYATKKRIFIFQYPPTDSDICTELYKEIGLFRQHVFDKPSYIFILNTHPSFYKETFINFRLIFSNIVYLSVADTDYFRMVAKSNEERFGLKLEKNFFKHYFPLIGSNAVFIKECVKLASNLDKYPKDTELQTILEPYLQQLLNEVPDQELLLLKRYYSNERITLEEEVYLKEMGIYSNNSDFPLVLSRFVKNFSRNYAINVVNNRVYLNGKTSNELFSKRELQLVIKLFENEITTREEIGKIIFDYTDSYSDYAIDKVLSRLRKKFEKVGVNSNIVKTLKGKGFAIDKNIK
jgi:hypothetical protein